MKGKKIGRRVRILMFIRRVLGLDELVQFDLKLKSYVTITAELNKLQDSDKFINRELSHALANELVRSRLIDIISGQSYKDFTEDTITYIGKINIVK
jgi:hypothetical protein